MKRLAACVLAAGCLLAAAPSYAQHATSARPFRGIFGGGGSPAHKLDLTAGLVESYDREAADALGSSEIPGFSTMFVAGADYEFKAPGFEVGVTGATTLRYYSRLNDVTGASHSVGAGFSAPFGRRTSVAVNQTASYSPSNLFGLFPGVSEPGVGDAPPLAADYFDSSFESLTYATTATLNRGLTARDSFALTALYSFNDFLQETVSRQDLSHYRVTAQFERGISRRTTLNASYQYSGGDYGFSGASKTNEHAVKIGMGHSRPVSPTRRFNVAFGVGPSLTMIPADGLHAYEDAQVYTVSGELAVDYQFGRTWQARGTYRRGVEFVAELTEPVFTDSASATAGGLLARRVDLFLAAGFSNGGSAIHRSQSAFSTYTVSAQLRYAIGANTAAYAEYLHYFYDFSESPQLRPGLPPRLDRNGIRFGITLWVPAFGRY